MEHKNWSWKIKMEQDWIEVPKLNSETSLRICICNWPKKKFNLNVKYFIKILICNIIRYISYVFVQIFITPYINIIIAVSFWSYNIQGYFYFFHPIEIRTQLISEG